DPLLQSVFERLQPPFAKTLLRQGGEFLERALGYRFEPARLGGEDDEEGAPVRGVSLAVHEPFAFEQPHHRRHRLLAQMRPARKPRPPRGGEGGGAVARPHVAPTGGAETVVQLLVPALGRLGEQEAEVVSIHNLVLYQTKALLGRG